MTERVHLTYTEPHAEHGTWTSTAHCFDTREDAERWRTAVTRIAGPNAAARRTWTFSPCDCPRKRPSLGVVR